MGEKKILVNQTIFIVLKYTFIIGLDCDKT